MSKEPVLILGARSDIAQATARRFAALGHAIQLAARQPERLEIERADIALRGNVPVSLHGFDALDIAGFESFIDGLPELPLIVVSAIGTMNEQHMNEADPQAAIRDIRSNFEGPALILGMFANRFEARGRGTIVGISSVAGERGRATNYVYGAAKAGFTAFLSGLRNRLAKTEVRVLTVKPGFVATRMTDGMDLPARLTASPDEVAEAITRAVRRRRNVIYVRPVWGLIMLVIRAIPEAVFMRLKL